MGIFSFIFGIFGKRPEPEKERGTVVYQSPDEPPVPADMERHVGLINAAIETFDGTSDIDIKADQLPIIERELAEILRLEPESSGAHQLKAMLPDIKTNLYLQAAEKIIEEKIAEEHAVMQRSEPLDPSIDEMRQGLQKVAYGMVGKGVGSDEKARFKQGMTEFASADPLVREIAERVRDLVAETPGLLQSKIYGNFPEYDKEQVRYALYFANELGLVHRKKKGNSYELFPPGTVIDME